MAKTPPTEIYAKDDRGEAGFEAETLIFGSPVAYITNSAARELIRHDDSDLNDFNKKFIGLISLVKKKKLLLIELVEGSKEFSAQWKILIKSGSLKIMIYDFS